MLYHTVQLFDLYLIPMVIEDSTLFLLFLHYSDNTKTTMSNNSSGIPFQCQGTNPTAVSITYTLGRLLLYIPISIFVVYLGYQRWRQQRSFATTSHTDIFVYHKLAFDMFSNVGTFLFSYGVLLEVSEYIKAGILVSCFDIPSQTLLHILTCIERYLAVIHPVTYMRLKQSGGSRVRNISLGCVWLQSFLWIFLFYYDYPNIPVIPHYLMLSVCFIIVSFCSARVLWVLIHPRPGDAPGGRVKVDQSKRKAFNTIAIITATTWLHFVGIIVYLVGERLSAPSNQSCILLVFTLWISLPINLLLPIFFIHRSGIVSCCN